MRFLFLSIIVAMIACSTASMQPKTAQKTKASKPNIILVFADDISARELPIYNSDSWSSPQNANTTDKAFRAQTPVLDRLAKEGCYIKTTWAATVCSPSRAMMMTGRYAHLHKWWINDDIGKVTLPNGKQKPWPLYESSSKTIGFIAKDGGYATYWAGKTQMKGSDVRKFGFDEGCLTPGEEGAEDDPYTDFRVSDKKDNGKKGKGKNLLINEDTGEEVSTYAQSGWYWKPHVRLMNSPNTKETLEWWPNTPQSKKEFGLNTFGPDVELDFIFNFMKRKKDENKPFFIYHTSHLGHDAMDFLHPNAHNKWPGTPVIKWENNKYTRTQPNVTGDKGVYDTHGTVTEAGIHNHVNYLDYQVWLYLNKMKELGIEDNTILIFCADNGTSGYGKQSPISQRGTHVPLIIYAPGMNLTKKGEQDILVNIADVLPTIAEITGTVIPANYEVNGKSLWSYLTTSQTTHRDWIYAYHKEKQLIRGAKVLRDGNGTWWDVSQNPKDLISFPKITDWEKVSPEHRKERDLLNTILPKYDVYATEHDAPKGK